jgi:hypothetical protein
MERFYQLGCVNAGLVVVSFVVFLVFLTRYEGATGHDRLSVELCWGGGNISSVSFEETVIDTGDLQSVCFTLHFTTCFVAPNATASTNCTGSARVSYPSDPTVCASDASVHGELHVLQSLANFTCYVEETSRQAPFPATVEVPSENAIDQESNKIGLFVSLSALLVFAAGSCIFCVLHARKFNLYFGRRPDDSLAERRALL